jgi:hypothetical protein
MIFCQLLLLIRVSDPPTIVLSAFLQRRKVDLISQSPFQGIESMRNELKEFGCDLHLHRQKLEIFIRGSPLREICPCQQSAGSDDASRLKSDGYCQRFKLIQRYTEEEIQWLVKSVCSPF